MMATEQWCVCVCLYLLRDSGVLATFQLIGALDSVADASTFFFCFEDEEISKEF